MLHLSHTHPTLPAAMVNVSKWKKILLYCVLMHFSSEVIISSDLNLSNTKSHPWDRHWVSVVYFGDGLRKHKESNGKRKIVKLEKPVKFANEGTILVTTVAHSHWEDWKFTKNVLPTKMHGNWNVCHWHLLLIVWCLPVKSAVLLAFLSQLSQPHGTSNGHAVNLHPAP